MAILHATQATQAAHHAAEQLADLDWIDQAAAQQLLPLAEAVELTRSAGTALWSPLFLLAAKVARISPFHLGVQQWPQQQPTQAMRLVQQAGQRLACRLIGYPPSQQLASLIAGFQSPGLKG